MNFSPPRDARQDKKILLTGASGVVGHALLEQLSSNDVICLVHKNLPPDADAETIRGDISQPDLGLSPAQVADLRGRVGWIVHSAATTCFSASDEETLRTNVRGTQHMVALAKSLSVPMTLVSTAFVQPVHGPSGAHLFNEYERSKQQSEDVARQSGHQVSIVRPSIILGDSESGCISDFQGFHQVLALILQGRLPVLPALPEGRIDCIPRDTVASSILSLIAHDVRDGEFWLTAGRDALCLREMVDTITRTYRAITGRSVTTPDFVGPEYIDILTRRDPAGTVTARQRSSYRQLAAFTKYLSIIDTLPSSLKLPVFSNSHASNRDAASVLARNVSAWVEHVGLTSKTRKKPRTTNVVQRGSLIGRLSSAHM